MSNDNHWFLWPYKDNYPAKNGLLIELDHKQLTGLIVSFLFCHLQDNCQVFTILWEEFYTTDAIKRTQLFLHPSGITSKLKWHKSIPSVLESNTINSILPWVALHITRFSIYYSNVRWTSWHGKSLAIGLFAQKIIQAYNTENIKAKHYWPFVRGIHNGIVLTKGQ